MYPIAHVKWCDYIQVQGSSVSISSNEPVTHIHMISYLVRDVGVFLPVCRITIQQVGVLLIVTRPRAGRNKNNFVSDKMRNRMNKHCINTMNLLVVHKWMCHSHLLWFKSLKTCSCISSYGPLMPLALIVASVRCITTVPHPITSLPHMMGCGFEHYLLTFQWDLESNLASISKNRNKPRQACANCQLFAHRPPPRGPFLLWAPHPDSLDTSRAVVHTTSMEPC